MGSSSTSLQAIVLRAEVREASGGGLVPDLSVSAIELDAWSLDWAQIYRVLNNIDVGQLLEQPGEFS
jgi:hypothetical protein